MVRPARGRQHAREHLGFAHPVLSQEKEVVLARKFSRNKNAGKCPAPPICVVVSNWEGINQNYSWGVVGTIHVAGIDSRSGP